MVDTYSPAQVTRRSGFSLDTLRYYEKIGLVEHIERAASGHRRYTEDDLGWLDMLQCLRGTGMPIAQMLEFAEQVRAGDHTIPDRIALLAEHDREVGEEMERLAERRRKVQAKIAYYRGVIGESDSG
jgi:DNA-binding transcriptional MerR regulator